MIIDVHSHLNPKEWSQNRPASMFNVEAYMEAQEKAGIDLTVFSNPMIGRLPALDLRTLDNIKRFHEFAAGVVAKYPGRLAALACTVPFGGDAFLEETRKAITTYNFKGVMINPSFNGEFLDSERAYPFYELMQEMNIPVFVHPPGLTVGSEYMREYRLVEMVGRPWETTLGLARMIYSGVLERFPRLKLVCSHLGGAITMLAGRLDYGYEERAVEGFGPWGPDVITKKPSDYIKMLYLDTVCFHQPAVLCALQTVGEDHLVFGTDYPPVTIPLSRSIRLIQDLPLPEKVKEKILGDNATELLRLTGSS